MTQADEIMEQVGYDPTTGKFIWKVAKKGTAKGTPAGNRRPDGYIRICIGRRLFYAHRVAWVLMTGTEPPSEIDHINGNPGDNRWANLRAASPSQNKINRAAPQPHGFRGVAKAGEKWRAQINVNGKTQHLGVYATPEAAHNAYRQAAKEHHGQFRRFT